MSAYAAGRPGGRRRLVSGNWKMNHTHYEAIQMVHQLAARLRAAPLPDVTDVSLHPAFTALRSVQTALESDGVPVALGAQDCHFEERGAFTGEVSAEMLAKLNVSYVIVGHSERRRYAGETDEIVRRKLDAVLSQAMTPILCVGETSSEREDGLASATVASQLDAVLSGRSPEVIAGVVVAYEPIWAIGTGRSASPDDAQEMAAHIRGELVRLGGGAADSVRIQYGGSVTDRTAAELHDCPDVDGLLVGGASLEAAAFEGIIRAGS